MCPARAYTTLVVLVVPVGSVKSYYGILVKILKYQIGNHMYDREDWV